ncbi:MAG: sulfite exporter TauE/SafE family protein [Thermanaerothrix sp.]|nr:sulfite exporter TauE/SafE family protein [Thermanaerothrix sp.]
MDWLAYLSIALAAVAAGAVNALAGGGTLITFPALMAVGVPAVVANVTNTVALLPGYLGGTWAQRADLRGQAQRLRTLLPAALLGGLVGGLLLLLSGERLFRALVPYLILFASLLLAVQDEIRKRVFSAPHVADPPAHSREAPAVLPVFLAAIYGGYFGAGLSVILLAVLGLVLEDTLTRLNALKQGLSLATNLTAALYFIFSGRVLWSAALVMAGGALLGGMLGGFLAGRVKPIVLRWLVVSIGCIVAVIYFVRG